jgi:UDP-N-acetyl-2-amino-2-deoxyglucuronate dehydrogenase
LNDLWTLPGDETLHTGWNDEERDHPGFPSFHGLQLQDFVDSLQQNRPPAVTGAEAVKSLEIIQAIYESSRTGKPVTLPLARR